MSAKPNYFRIGVFILAALGVLLASLLIFGSGQLFKKHITLETYVDGTVQGVDIGSPVKFRGVQIGHVTSVSFTFNEYASQLETDRSNMKNYVVIRMIVDKEVFPGMFTEDLQPVLNRNVEKGLRLRIEPQGITGISYLEMNYLNDPNQFPPLVMNWKPYYYYIPSAPGELTSILDSVNKMMRDVEKMNLGEIQGGLETLLKNLNTAVVQANIGKVSSDLQIVLEQAKTAIAAANVGPLSDEARTLMAGLEKTNKNLDTILKNIEPSTHLNSEEIKEIVSNLATATANAEQLTKVLKDKPSLLLWGSPPKEKAEPTPKKKR